MILLPFGDKYKIPFGYNYKDITVPSGFTTDGISYKFRLLGIFINKFDPRYLTADKAPENYDDLEGYDFPYIHKTANLIAKERKTYKLYCQVALSLRGFYWWTPLYLFFAFIGLISYIEAIIIGILLGVAFPIACEIGKRLNYNGKFGIINYSKGWENQELVYGLFQGLFFNYVIITNII